MGDLSEWAKERRRIHATATEQSKEQSMTSSEPHTPSDDDLVRTYVEHLGPITLGTEFARQQEARRGLNKIKADALREAAKALPKPVGLNCNTECHSVDWASLRLRADRIEGGDE